MTNNKDGILALDFGTNNVGIAISHGFVAEALKSLTYLEHEEEFFKKICQIAEEQKVGKIIIGLPLLEDSQDSIQSNWIREQAMELSKRVDEIDIEFVDEAYTTVQAIDELEGNGDVDSRAAKIILEQYLADLERTNNS